MACHVEGWRNPVLPLPPCYCGVVPWLLLGLPCGVIGFRVLCLRKSCIESLLWGGRGGHGPLPCLHSRLKGHGVFVYGRHRPGPLALLRNGGSGKPCANGACNVSHGGDSLPSVLWCAAKNPGDGAAHGVNRLTLLNPREVGAFHGSHLSLTCRSDLGGTLFSSGHRSSPGGLLLLESRERCLCLALFDVSGSNLLLLSVQPVSVVEFISDTADTGHCEVGHRALDDLLKATAELLPLCKLDVGEVCGLSKYAP